MNFLPTIRLTISAYYKQKPERQISADPGPNTSSFYCNCTRLIFRRNPDQGANATIQIDTDSNIYRSNRWHWLDYGTTNCYGLCFRREEYYFDLYNHLARSLSKMRIDLIRRNLSWEKTEPGADRDQRNRSCA